MATSFTGRLGNAPEEGIKAPVVVATTAAITLSGEQTINTVAVVANDRVLVKNQADDADNGIFNASAGAWTRAKDFNEANDVVNGVMVLDAFTTVLRRAAFTGSFTPDTTDVTFPTVGTFPSPGNSFYAEAYDTFALAVAAAAGSELIVSESTAITGNITVSDVTLRFIRGGLLDVSTSITATLDCEIDAGEIVIFTGAGTVVGSFGGVPIKVLWFDETSDFGARMTKAFDVVRSQTEYSIATATAESANIIVPGGRYVATTPINGGYSGSRAIKVDCQSMRGNNFCTVSAEHNGVGLDLTGTRLIEMNSFGIQGGDSLTSPSAGSIPSVGILQARKDVGSSNGADYYTFNKCVAYGHFTFAAWYNYGAEITSWYDCYIVNRLSDADATGLTITQDNKDGLASTFGTIASGNQSTTQYNFNGGNIWQLGGGGVEKAVWLDVVGDCHFTNTFVQAAEGLACFYIDGGNNISVTNVREENAGATGGSARTINQVNTTNGLTVRGLSASSLLTSGYSFFMESSAVINGLTMDHINSSHANKYVHLETVTYAEVAASVVGKVHVEQNADKSRIVGSPLTWGTGAETDNCDAFCSETGARHTLSRKVTASVNDGATVDVNISQNYPSNCLFAYHIESTDNTNHQSSGFFRTNGAGGSGNALVLFGQSESEIAASPTLDCAVTVPTTNTLRIANETGGATTFTVRISVLAGGV